MTVTVTGPVLDPMTGYSIYEVAFNNKTFDLKTDLDSYWALSQKSGDLLTISESEQLVEELTTYIEGNNLSLLPNKTLIDFPNLNLVNTPISLETTVKLPNMGDVPLSLLLDTRFHKPGTEVSIQKLNLNGVNAVKIQQGDYFKRTKKGISTILYFDSEGQNKIRFEGVNKSLLEASLIAAGVDMTEREINDLFNELTSGVEIKIGDSSKLKLSNVTDLLPDDLQNLVKKLNLDNFSIGLFKSENFLYFGKHNIMSKIVDFYIFNQASTGALVNAPTLYLKQNKDGDFEQVSLDPTKSSYSIITIGGSSYLFDTAQNIHQGVIEYQYDTNGDGVSDLTIYSPLNPVVDIKIHLELLKHWLFKARYVAKRFGTRQPAKGNLQTYVNLVFTTGTKSKFDSAGTGKVGV